MLISFLMPQLVLKFINCKDKGYNDVVYKVSSARKRDRIRYKKLFFDESFLKILDWVVPKANPALEDNIDKVFVWYVEYDTADNYTNREIGMDAEENVVFKAPYEDNLGYWVDNDLTLENYRSFNPVSVSAKEFETLWDKPFIV